MLPVVAAAAVLTAVAMARWPHGELDMEFYPAFAEAAAGGWRCMVSMDRVQHPDVVMPYTSWPPAYMIGLCLLGKTGLSFTVAAAAWNLLLLLLGAWWMLRLCIAAGLHAAAPAAALLTVLGPAHWTTATIVFPHVLTIAVMTGMAASACGNLLPSHAGGGRLAGFGAGFIAGLSHWMAFLMLPALWLGFRMQRNRLPEGAMGRFGRWMAGCALGLGLAFLTFLVLQRLAVPAESRIELPGASLAERLRLRLLPTPRTLAGAGFFGVLRFMAAGGLVLVAAVAAARWHRGSRSEAERMPPPGRAMLWAFGTAAALFTFLLSGETAVPTHIFHSRLHAPLVVIGIALSLPGLARPGKVAAFVVMGAMSLLAMIGEPLLPDRVIAGPSLVGAEVGFLAPGDHVRPAAGSEFSAAAVARTAVKQLVSVSLDGLAARDFEARGRTWSWLRGHADFLRGATAPDDVITGWHEMSITAPWVLDRSVTGMPDTASLRIVVDGLLTKLPPGRLVVAVPVEVTAEAVTDALALPGLALVPLAASDDLALFRASRPALVAAP